MGREFGRGIGQPFQRATVKAGKGLDLTNPIDQLADDRQKFSVELRRQSCFTW